MNDALPAGFAWRIMQAQDVAEVAALEQAAYVYPWSAANFRDSLAHGYHAWLLCEENGAVAGYSICMDVVDEVHLLNIAVRPDLQRRGLARCILQRAIGMARAGGMQSMLLEVRPGNQRARALYERMGFVQIGLRKGYYPAQQGREDALVLRLNFD
ncbi:ribosomal protein S18-alanine N-acetyltransferase [Massilia sp. W12]|uniref:ribosomal protein S18-alanine N-acetyltransferase n=1 Tax=Massilia sp. W12 TaxID=3126507 RepID=UPI0030D19699